MASAVSIPDGALSLKEAEGVQTETTRRHTEPSGSSSIFSSLPCTGSLAYLFQKQALLMTNFSSFPLLHVTGNVFHASLSQTVYEQICRVTSTVRHPGHAAPDEATPSASCNFAARVPSLEEHRSNFVEPAPRFLQLGRGGRLIFQYDLLLEEVTEAFRFGCNPFADRGCG